MPGRGRAGRRLLRRGCFVVVALCYVIAIPWYRTPGAAPAILFGLPDWVAVALGCYVLAAGANALAWTLTDVEDDGA